ncbi:uncharacterized protein LOC111642970 isoform X2 [Copidosoma floridanum]|uniref:uncharacterized protein LOC111642970 isoform X2 n=1 Tax=Copidosoma floridanum TaxID=29053 RepID=UPI000C6F51F4|nr:uncharacterized protein LOC111642970 isoform X2 [Copidosoma floridanum]
MPASYESPEVASALTPHQIRQRYRDTSLVIFKIFICLLKCHHRVNNNNINCEKYVKANGILHRI